MLSSIELRHRLRAVPSHVLQVCSDRLLNIATLPDSSAEQVMAERFENDVSRDYRTRFQSANYLYLRRIAELVKPKVPGQSVFYDLGCGKGRALCVMARHAFKKVVGVELRAELCESARDNAERMRGRVAPIEVVQGDATQPEFADGDVYFFYNPFGAPTFRKVLRNLVRSLERAPRPLTLVYYNALHEALARRLPMARAVLRIADILRRACQLLAQRLALLTRMAARGRGRGRATWGGSGSAWLEHTGPGVGEGLEAEAF